MTKDIQGNPKLFAVHASRAAIDMDPEDIRWVVQWYVIEPDLDNFDSGNPEGDDSWQPSIEKIGRIWAADGDCYLPTLAVSSCGRAMIEYTFSNLGTYPQVRRAIINYSYDGVLSDTLLQAGAQQAYGGIPSRWALYPDMQADAFSGGFWSTHTLVGDTTSIRDVWLMRSVMNCFTTDLNADGLTDPFDLMLYSDYYMTGDERADTNADGVVDVVDMDNFLNAYQEATRP